MFIFFSTSVFAIDDTEVQKIKSFDLLFTYVENTIVLNWRNYPKQLKSEIYEFQYNWVKYYRDDEAKFLIELGWTPVDAYIICTAMRNNQLVSLLPPKEQNNYIVIDIKELVSNLLKRYNKNNGYKNELEDKPSPYSRYRDYITSSTNKKENNDNLQKQDNKLFDEYLNKQYLLNKTEILIFKVFWIILIVVIFISLMLLNYYNPFYKLINLDKKRRE
jgi:hypothetical protein